ncbi:MAG: hypothetical protein GX640_23955 [Fibrobacter sp.]|nr:hypothetical protein [Fibrobacter sp.]
MKIATTLLLLALSAAAVEPNYIRTTVYKVGKDGTTDANLTTTTYSDGLGRQLQTKVGIADDKDLTICTFYDAAGRPFISTKPFIDQANTGLYLPGTLEQINASASQNSSAGPLRAQYASYDENNDGDPKAYSKTFYSDDPTGRIIRSVAIGDKYQGNSSADEVKRSTQVWVFGMKRVEQEINCSTYKVKVKNGFITSFSDQTKVALILDILEDQFLTDIPFEPDHFLTVTKDPNGNLTQELKDGLGRTVATRADPAGRSDVIIAEYEYDISGNLIKELPPKSDPEDNSEDGSENNSKQLLEPTTYTYNTLGQLERKDGPDCGPVEYTYDKSGNLIGSKIFRRGVQPAQVAREMKYIYDAFNRLTSTQVLSINRNGIPFYDNVIENIYDSFESLSGNEKRYNIPAGLLNEKNLRNTKGNLVASIASNRINGITYFVVDLFDYNEENQIATKYKIIPGIPGIQKISYEYDLQGKVLKETFSCGSELQVKNYQYDKFGQLQSLKHNNEEFVSYNYNELMQLDRKNLPMLQTPEHVDYKYTLQDQLEKIIHSGANAFQEILGYDNDWSGNIQKTDFTYKNGNTTKPYNLSYVYDKTGRLTNVNTSDNNFKSEYGHDNVGHLKMKKEGQLSNNDDYSYYTGTNRLKKAKSQNGGLYIYDEYGNCVIDMSKKMVTLYDWRDMPASFRFYRSIPAGEETGSKIKPDSRGTYKINDARITADLEGYCLWAAQRGEMELISTVYMLYDASGNRVLKIE